MRFSSTLLLFCLLTPAFLRAQTAIPVEGSVADQTTGNAIGGAAVRATDKASRTYTSASGRFRIPLAPGRQQLTISSLGFHDTTISVDVVKGMPRLEIRLRPAPLRLEGVDVNAGLTAGQIVRNAIAKKEENRRRAKTVQGLLYSKVTFRLDGDAFGQLKDADRDAITETFSRAYYSERGPRIIVIQRRQTANVPSQSNLVALGNFVSFYDDELPVLNARIPSPLNEGTLSRYSFSIRERKSLNNETVWVIDVKPATRLLPAFEGTITIAASNYNLIEVDLAPSEWTAISFVRNLRLRQKFEKITEDIWQPTFLDITARANVTIVEGIAELDAAFTATSFFTELVVNAPIPDSVYAGDTVISAAPSADSSRPEFWEGNSLSELSDAERETYKRVDSLVAAADTNVAAGGGTFNFTPYLDFNRVASITPGLRIGAALGPVSLSAFGAWSFGQKHGVGDVSARVSLLHEEDGPVLRLNGSVFSSIASTTNDAVYPRLFNTVYAALLHRDYYDYFRKDGWNAGFDMSYGRGTLDANVEMARHFALENTTSRSIFQHKAFRPNMPIPEGSYRTANARIAWGRPENAIVISSSTDMDAGLALRGFYGEHTESGAAFRSAEGSFNIALPTIPTGYLPMLLTLYANAGIGSANLPPQYQFRMPTSMAFIGTGKSFLSAPVARYGGTRYATLVGEHNFSDILWRAVGLPTFQGRGIELRLTGAAGWFENENTIGYTPTGGQWYTEVGFGLGRIPTFISNVFYLGFDARWGIGPLGSGKFGMVVNLTSPF